MNRKKKPGFLFSFMVWCLIFAQTATASLQPDNKITQKASISSLAPQHLDEVERSQALVGAVLTFIKNSGFQPDTPVALIQKQVLDQFRNDASYAKWVNLESLRWAEGVLCIEYTDPSDGNEYSMTFKPDQDLRGKKAERGGPVLKSLISDVANNNFIEIVLDGDDLKAYRIAYVDGYVPGVTDSNKYKGRPFDLRTVFGDEEIGNIKKWLSTHTIVDTGKPVKFRVLLGNAAIGWVNNIEHSNIAHAGVKDGAIYIGGLLLRYIMKDFNLVLREKLLDQDEFQHLNKQGHGSEEEYEARCLEVERAVLPLNEIRRAMISDNWKYLRNKLRSGLVGADRDPSRLFNFLAVCNEVSVGQPNYPIESRWPVLRAVALLNKEEKKALIDTLKANPRMRRIAVIDSIMLEWGNDIPQDWMDIWAPRLRNRTIIQAASEIWYAAGGLGRVMQFHGEGIHEILSICRDFGAKLIHVEPRYSNRPDPEDKELKNWIPLDYSSHEAISSPIATPHEVFAEFPVTYSQYDELTNSYSMVNTRATVYRGVNDMGIEVFLIKEGNGTFMTNGLYRYGNGNALPKYEQFADFISKATLELSRIISEKEKSAQRESPLLHTNDAQFSLVGLDRTRDDVTYTDQAGTKRTYKDDPVTQSIVLVATTHTVPNRNEAQGEHGKRKLYDAGVPPQYWYHFQRDDWAKFDFTSCLVRVADRSTGVSKQFVAYVAPWDAWAKVNLVAITNGDARARTAKIFRDALRSTGEGVDIEHPDHIQLIEAKKKIKREMSFKPDRFFSSRPFEDQDGLKLDENKYVLTYSGRLVDEKAGRQRALTDKNIEELVKAGVQVIIAGNVQNSAESRKLADGIKDLIKKLEIKKYSGKLVFIPRFNIDEQRHILAASDFGVVDSNPRTEAAGFSEVDYASVGAIVVAPPWPGGEGILVNQGIELDPSDYGCGNTLIPKPATKITEEMISRGSIYQDPIRQELEDAYLDVMKSVIMEMSVEEIAQYQATSVLLSRVLSHRLTAAEYLRQYSMAVEEKEVATKKDMAYKQNGISNQEAKIKDLKGPKAPDSNTVIRDLIISDKIFEITVEDGVLRAYKIHYSEGYRSGKTDPNRYRGPPLDINVLFTREEQESLVKWACEHLVNGKTVKFRVAEDQSALGWKDDIEHSNVSHAGFSDGAIYIGEKLLKYILRTENADLLGEILDKDELEHLKGNFRDNEGLHRYRLKMVSEAIEKLEARDRVRPASLSGSAIVFKRADNPFKKVLEDPATREVHIITAGGGGDVLGGAFMALQLRRLMAGGIKIKVFTSNLKRGDENPEGGPLRMANIKDSFGNSICPMSGASHFYRIDEGLYADTAIKDANLNEVRGYRAKVPLSEGRIIDLLHKEGIELIMTDVSRSGKELSEDYINWQRSKGNIGHVFVLGLDMGGDILARFSGIGKITERHPESGVRSPNTDAVFLDMFAELERSRILPDRVLVGVSALGGDGELGETLLKYIEESLRSSDIEGALDNIKFIADNDPQGDRYLGTITAGLVINSEVSGNFLMRLLAIARITPLLDRSFVGTFENMRMWGDVFGKNNRARGFSGADIFNPGVLSAELPKGASRGLIRNKSREEVLPWAYPLTVFMRPSAIHARIEDPVMKDTSLAWLDKDDYLRNKRNYQTEISDRNNVDTRQFINAYLLKSSILERAWTMKERSERSNFIANELSLLRSKHRLYPGVENDLERIRSMLSENIDDITAEIAYKLNLSEEGARDLTKRLDRWLKNTEDRLRSSKNVSAYVYSYFVAHILGEIAEFFGKSPEPVSVDEYMGMAERLLGSVEEIGKTSEGQILSSIMAESLLPELLRSSPDRKALIYKEKALLEFVKERFGGGLRTWPSFHFIRFVLPEAIGYGFSSEKHFKDALAELYDFAAEVTRTFPENVSDGSSSQHKDVNILIHYYIFEKIFPEALKICPDLESLKRFNGILRDLAGMIKAKKLRYSYVFPVLDFISIMVSSGKAKNFGDIEILKNTILAITADRSREDRNLSPAIRFIIKASRQIDGFDQTISFVKVLGAEILRVEHYTQSFTYHGAVYDISDESKAKVISAVKQYSGLALEAEVRKIDYNAPAGEEERLKMEEEFEDVEKDAFMEMCQKIKAGARMEELTILQGISSIKILGDFDRELDIERDSANYDRGLSILREGQCAAGCTAGFVSGIPMDYLNADFSMKIPGTDGRARRFIEWKIYMLERMIELYGLQKKPIPAVVMTAFAHNDLQRLFKETGNFGYRGDLIEFHQGPTKAIDMRGQALKIGDQDYYATPGAWGFVKWLIISGRLKELRDRGIRYLADSNINNPIEPVSASLLGYFDRKIEETRRHKGTVPIVLAELGDYAKERGGFAFEITYKDGRKERRIVHESRLPPDTPTGNSYNLANWVINLEGLWERFGLDEIYSGHPGVSADHRQLRKALASRVAQVEKESGIIPVLRERTIADQKCYINEYILDDLSALGHWVGVHVKRDRHFVSLKSPDDIYDYHRAQVMSDVMRNIEVEIFRKKNPIVDYLMERNILGPLQEETRDSLRARVVRLFLPSRLFKEDKSLLASGKRYIPGAYVQGEVTDEQERVHNSDYRNGIIETEIELLCRAYPEKAHLKDQLIKESREVLAKVLDLAYDDDHRLIDVITNPESNLLVRRCVRLVFFGALDISGTDGIDYNPYAVVNASSNDLVIRRLYDRGSSMTSEEMLLESVAAIKLKTYFQTHDNMIEDFDKAYAQIFSEIDEEKRGKVFESAEDVKRFLEEVSAGKKMVAYVTDDNGEVVYHLYLIQRYLENNPDLTITLIPRSRQNGIDASFDDILQILSCPMFEKLREMFGKRRFVIVKDSTRMGGVDLLRASPETRTALDRCDFVFSAGLVNHETIYNYRKPAYHIFKVHGRTAELVTGRPKGTYIFTHKSVGEMISNPFQTEDIKDLSGGSATPYPDDNIRDLISAGQVVELSYDRLGLAAYQVRYVDRYHPGVTDIGRTRGPPVALLDLFSAEQLKNLSAWFKSHDLDTGKKPRIRMVMGQAAIGWKGDIDHSTISHAGERDGVIYIGELLLKRIMAAGNELLREEILDKDELGHLLGKGHGTEAEYLARLEKVAPVVKELEEAPRKTRDLTVTAPEEMAKVAAEKVAAEIRRLQDARKDKDVTMVFATGNTMVKFLDELSKAQGINWKRLQAYHLDEYKGLGVDHPASFAYFLNKNLFSKIPLPRGNIHYVSEYVARYSGDTGKAFERYLGDMGIPDIIMLGIGMDGHLAFNEPPKYSSFASHMQEISLDDSTVDANKTDYPELETDPATRFAYTMGMADIFASRKIFFLANGLRKADIVAKAMLGPITEEVPASVLQRHHDVTWILDSDAHSTVLESETIIRAHDSVAAGELDRAVSYMEKLLPEGSRITRRQILDKIVASNLDDPRRLGYSRNGVSRRLPLTVIFDGSVFSGYKGEAQPRFVILTSAPKGMASTTVFSATRTRKYILAKGGCRWWQVGDGPPGKKIDNMDEKMRGNPSKNMDALLKENVRLAEAMEFKSPFWESYFDGGKTVFLAEKDVDKEEFVRDWVASSILAGSLMQLYIGGPDGGMGEHEMGWIEDEKIKASGLWGGAPWEKILATTSRDPKIIGTFPHEEWTVTSAGVVETMLTALSNRELRQEFGVPDIGSGKVTVAVTGTGDVGGGIPWYLDRSHKQEFDRIIMQLWGNRSGSVYCKAGLDKEKIIDIVRRIRSGALSRDYDVRQEFKDEIASGKYRYIQDPREAYFCGAMIMLPAAMGEFITSEADIKRMYDAGTRMYIEGANNSIAAGLQELFGKYGVCLFDGPIANGGGIYSSKEEFIHALLEGVESMFEHMEERKHHVQGDIADIAIANALWLIEQVQSGKALSIYRAHRDITKKIIDEKARLLDDPSQAEAEEIASRVEADIRRGVDRNDETVRVLTIVNATELARENIMGAVIDKDKIVNTVNSDNIYQARAAAYWAGKFRISRAATKLIGILKDRLSEPHLARLAAISLGYIGWPETLAILKGMIRPGLSEEVRGGIEWALNYMKANGVADVGRSTDLIHAFNLEYMPPVPKDTTLYHVIPESLIPEDQMRNPGGFSQRKALRDLLRSLDRDLKDVRERIYLATDDEINNYDKLMKSVSEKEKTLTGRQITIDIACGDMGTLEMYLGKGVKGLIFRPENEKDPGKIVQVEGIIAALRALHIDDPAQRNERLGRIFTLLTGDPVPPDLPTDLRELAKKLQFILPPIGKRDQDKELRGLNDNMFKLLVAA